MKITSKNLDVIFRSPQIRRAHLGIIKPLSDKELFHHGAIKEPIFNTYIYKELLINISSIYNRT